ncbi:MAG: YjbH domain-containing protein [Deferrisomatales bacterium]
MTTRPPVALLAALFLAGSAAGAQPLRTAPSFQGFTGLVNVPNAEVTPDGALDLLYSNQSESRWRDRVPYQDNYLFSVGFLPYFEGSARLAEAPGEARDLSASFKVQVPPWVPYLPRLAFGMQDAKSSVPHFRTKYAVASQELWRLRLSLGYGAGPDRMDGVFGGGELQVCEWLQLVGEHDTEEWSGAVRLLTPDGLLPGGSTLGLTAKTSLDHDPGTFELAVSLRLPLGGTSPSTPAGRRQLRAAAADRAAPAPPTSPAPPPLTPAATPPSEPVLSPAHREALAGLRKALGDLGFENLRVGVRRGSVLALEFENNRYNHSELDGLGLALGTALAHAPDGLDAFVVWVKNRDLRVVEASGPAAPFRRFFQTAPGQWPSPGELRALAEQLRVRGAPGSSELADVAWLEGSGNPRILRSALVLHPGIANSVGTEVGVFDYRLSLKADLLTSLWPGAELNLRWDLRLARSDEYQPRGAFYTEDEVARLERVFLNQAFSVAPGVMTLFGAGLYVKDVYGVMNETWWTPGSGAHGFRLRAGAFDGEHQDTEEVLVGSYRYHFAPVDLSIEAGYGRYLNQDRGPFLEVKRFFGDTQFTLYYADTEEKIAGFRISLPLTPRRDLKPGLVQVRGADRWTYGLSTTIMPLGAGNRIVPGLAVIPQTSHSLERTYYGGDRLHEAYLAQHLDRLLEAYRRWGAGAEE